MVQSNFRAWFRGKRGWAVDGGTRVQRPLCCQGTAKSTLFFSAQFVSSHFHPNQTSISHLILISQLPQPIIISPVCAPECLLWVFIFSPPPTFFTLDLFSLWFLFLQQSISLFNLMLFSCLSRLCVWFSFSWRLAGKRAGFYPKILFLKKKKRKEKHDHACIQSRKSLKIWGEKMADSSPITGTF